MSRTGSRVTMLFVPVVQLIINVAVLVLAIYQKPHQMGIGLLILFAGVPVYWLGVLWRSKPKEFTSMIGSTENLDDLFDGTTQEPGKFAVAIFYSIFSNGGWNNKSGKHVQTKRTTYFFPIFFRDTRLVGVVPQQLDARKGTADVQLKKSINLLHCTAIMVAATGHSSVFISPAAILGLAGSVGASLVVWLVGGLINLGLALCFAELGTMLPKAGGHYVYVMHTFGPLAGFLMMWGYVVLISGPIWAFLAYTAALYIVKPAFPECQPEQMDTGVKILAGWIMITMVALNCVYMKYVTKIQTLLSSTKIVALLIIIIAGFYQMAVGNTENLDDLFEGTTQEPGKFAVAIFYSIFSYGGWQVLTSLMEEVKNPGRDLPLSVYITFVIVIIKYILTNVAYYTLITPQELLRSSAIALMYMDRLYRPVSPLISVLVATTSIGALNACIMGHSRLLFAGARNGHMPLLMGMIHPKYLTPWPAIFALLVWSLVMLYSGSVTDMMEFISLFSSIMGIAVVCSLLYLRWKKPNEKRPYKTMLFVPVVQLIINLAVLVLAIYQKPHQMGIGLLILFAGVPVYWLGVLWRSKSKWFTSMMEGITVLIQKALLLAKSQ